MVYMPYTTNPHMPKVRMQAARLVLEHGWSTRQVARHYGFSHSSVVRWVNKARVCNRNKHTIPTESARPHCHPHKLSSEIIRAILDHRHQYGRCAEVIHYQLTKDGYTVSLSSVKRTLKRNGLTYPSKWKKWHTYPPRPIAEKPGILVQIDSILDGISSDRICIYSIIDVCSRWSYAEPVIGINSRKSVQFVKRAQDNIPFPVQLIQSDHGSEFAKWFTKQLLSQGIDHRHSRVRRPTDNAHIERFNRTIQQECISRIPRTLKAWKKNIPDFIHYYNTERPHMGLNMKTPLEVVQSY